MTRPSEKATSPTEKQPVLVPGTVSIDQVKPPSIMHQRDVSALTTFGDVAADNNQDASSLSFPTPPPSRLHNRGISVDLTRRHLMPHKRPEPLSPIPPPRARDVRPMAAEGRASTVKKTTWGAASKLDSKVVGLGTAARYSAGYHEKHDNDLSASLASRHKRNSISNLTKTIDDEEKAVRDNALTDPFKIMIIGNIAAVKVFGVYLITLDTILSISLSIGLTCYWYFTNIEASDTGSWSGAGMDWVLLGFAVVTPLSMAIGIAYRRRERALIDIARFRSFAYQIYLGHCLWDWGKPPNAGRSTTDCDWLRHTDSVLEQLIGIGDELTRFLTLPTYTRTRHRMMSSGRKEAARTVEVAYRLFDSLYTQRVMKLTMLTEAFKYEGLNHSEASRIRQYERFLGECIEDLRVIKTYRTPQALRAFGRVFTVILPPFYAPSFAQLAFDLNSLVMGILMSIITPLCLTALFESIQVLEDPFVGYITLDGIDVREEFQVLHWQQLVNARRIIFPYAPPFPAGPQPPVMWEVLTEELPRDDLIEDSAHSSDATATIDNTDLELGGLDEMNRISLHGLEAGYPSDDASIDMRTSNFRDVLRLQSNQPSSLGASFRTVRRRLPSVDYSVMNMNASKSSRQMRGSEHSRESIPEE
mmetsp:Transcript_2681/g.6195  ORF Transcript_2681/g.6195 Transcript_2681/m.6195 type:complete len:644 (-) Transcript_2681:688-2619(-)